MNIENLYREAEICYKTDHCKAKELYHRIVDEIGDKSIDEMDDSELRFFALSQQRIFLSSQFQDIESSDRAVEAFELFFERDEHDVETYSEYILTLELTYQYEKQFKVLRDLLSKDGMKPLALSFLSSISFSAEGLQTYDDCLRYKEQLIDVTDDPKEKKRLQKELDDLKNH